MKNAHKSGLILAGIAAAWFVAGMMYGKVKYQQPPKQDKIEIVSNQTNDTINVRIEVNGNIVWNKDFYYEIK